MKLLTALTLLLLSAIPTLAADSPWLTDITQARAQAKSANRDILMEFTGSDWCPACIQMEKTTLNSSEFKQYAAKNLILLRLDFPIRTPLPKSQTDQNNHLQDQYGVEGMLPTYILIDKSGKVINKTTGLVEGGPAAFINFLKGKKT